MNVPEALEKISKALGLLTHQTSAENRGGLFSKNRLAEDLLLPVFRIVFRAHDLRNVNQDALNFPYIDLVDEKARLAIQVTTERSAAKVTETLAAFIKNGYEKRYSRLIFFVLTGDRLRHTAASKSKWNKLCRRKLRFNPDADILNTPGLFPLIQGLQATEIFAVHQILETSVVGERHVDVEGYLTRLSRRQLDYEKKSGKYIPDIFVETRETKSLARGFAHPMLFFHRTMESLARLSYAGTNALLVKSGLPPLPSLDLRAFAIPQDLSGIERTCAQLVSRLEEINAVFGKYRDRKQAGTLEVKEDRRYYYEQSRYIFEVYSGFWFHHSLGGLVSEIKAEGARIFILTGRAGQGKTNLICDFVENFLFKHEIPCAYLTGRQLRSMATAELGDAVQRLLFEGKTTSFTEAARLLSDHAGRINKPFVLIIDGLNEHHRISEFAAQLEQFIGLAMEHPYLKLLLTCRSEFFQQRFGNLSGGPFEKYTFFLEANERYLERESYDDMMAGYFRYFGIQRDLVSERALQSLRQDLLLLRFFCEAYGSRNKPVGYRQPPIDNIYREDIFNIYLSRKLGAANLFFQHLTGAIHPSDRATELIAVLAVCLQHMLANWQFANVPISAVPKELNTALYALLDEEIILRRDAPPESSVFAPDADFINFTFDDFRDFLLAQYLVYRVFVSDRSKIQEYMARSNPKDSQVVEGLKKFLFYASRRNENAEFWEFYRGQAWYADVFDSEVFNIDADLLRPEDREAALAALNSSDERAYAFTRHLAINWHPVACPVLNLDLLLSVVAQATDEQFDRLIRGPFKTRDYRRDGLSASAFCRFISETVLPKFVPKPDAPENGLFRFLILLLPVDSGPDLNSLCYATFRELMRRHPQYAIRLLKESLDYKPRYHRPYVWRLLTLAPESLVYDESLMVKAQQDQGQSIEADPVLHREVTRFLSRFAVKPTEGRP
jgi:hypothetical protein